MASYKIRNNLPRFSIKVSGLVDAGLRELGNDILQASRKKAPKEHGDLRADSHTKRISSTHYQVQYNKEYAVYQEKGYGKHGKFRNYTTSGTGAKFLEDTGNKLSRKALSTLKKYMGKA